MLLSFLLLPLYNFPTKGQIVRWLEGTGVLKQFSIVLHLQQLLRNIRSIDKLLYSYQGLNSALGSCLTVK